MKLQTENLAPWLFTIGLFVFWELVCRVFNVSQVILPAPSAIFAATWQYFGPIARNSFVTLWTTIAGFALAVGFGLVLGLVVGWSRTIYRGLYPVMIGFNSIPKVAVVPVLVLWFGIGEIPAILTAFLISFFPVVVNVATGLATIEPELEDVLRALGASKLDVMRKVGIPRAMPYFFGSLKVAITLAFVGTVVSETIAANAGLGYLMAQAGSNFQMPLVFSGLLALAVLGIAMYAVTAWFEARMTGWAFRSQNSAGG
ncbi:MAG TPA: ABC transporter permease [Pseudolabrys sp.]|nr:ABC transporter permease [Pseudolabrys sp.]